LPPNANAYTGKEVSKMQKRYHGTVSTKGRGVVYEDWYETRHKAIVDLKREARETVLNGFDGSMNAEFTLSLGDQIIRTGHIPGRRFHRPYAGPVCSVYGFMPIGGTRIC
jgi:hypothetical protein